MPTSLVCGRFGNSRVHRHLEAPTSASQSEARLAERNLSTCAFKQFITHEIHSVPRSLSTKNDSPKSRQQHGQEV